MPATSERADETIEGSSVLTISVHYMAVEALEADAPIPVSPTPSIMADLCLPL
jgi:hypothetical protein